MRWGWARAAAVGLALSVVAASCGNAPPGQFAGSQGSAPGVTPTSIRVGGLASVTGPLGGQFGAAFDGAQAYFDMVNAAGGVDGRKIQMAARLDDQTDPSTDVSQARALLERYHVFAVVPVASPVFSAGS
ncbi:MAG TPA: ABC transporter substrate-binding protein, partial [Acidimicrobiales bacterium]|nr:ABC transporter substrate-binding protein [Acidimicrobiales bacterium]